MNNFLARIQQAHPELHLRNVGRLTGHGQFSEVLLAEDARGTPLVFRFPRTDSVAQDMVYELGILDQLQGKLPLPIPNPIYREVGADKLVFMGYTMLPGEPLWHETAAAITGEAVLDRLAGELAHFLKVLHSLDVQKARPIAETRDHWAGMYAAFREKLYPFMREDAKAQVTRDFETYLDDAANFDYTPTLRHGDFGGGNLLYDAQSHRISGVIDFGFAGYGDPAQDVGALSTYGEAFLRRGLAVYPEIEMMLSRATFYRSTYALQQALYALRSGDQDDFEDGMTDYV
jgi:aminoglycoside 2''-phosphotransferase